MEKLILKDNTELLIEEGASINKITVLISDREVLGTLIEFFTDANLAEVKFVTDNIVTGVYENMTLTTPHFAVTKLENGGLQVVFGLREKTREELQQDAVRTAIAYLSDEQALTVVALYPDWSPKGTYKMGDRRNQNGVLYKCLQDHTAQADWAPDVAPSLWVPVLIVDPDVIPEWVQPDSTNGCSTGDKVTHNGKTWESLVDNNVWEPGVAGTESLWKEAE